MNGSKRKRILLAVDGSDHSLATVDYVSRLIAPQTAQLVLYNAFSKIPGSFWDIEPNPKDHVTMARIGAWEATQSLRLDEFMEKARQRLLEAGFCDGAVEIKIKKIVRGVARDIEAESRREYDALVLGRRGSSRFKEFLLGATARKLIGKITNLPICIVNGNFDPRKTLLALDGSEESMQAAAFIGNLIKGPDREVMLFHCVPSATFPEDEKKFHQILKEEESVWVEDHLRSIKPFLKETKTRLLRLGFDERQISIKIATGAASRAGAIIEEARKGGYGSAVVGRRGITEVEEHSMGRVTDKVSQLARKAAVWLIN